MSTVAPTQSTPSLLSPLAGDSAPAFALAELYRFTVDQYERMVEAGILLSDERVELLHGYVVTKMPKGPGHVWAARFSETRFEALLGDNWCVRREFPARIPLFSEPESDLVIARGRWETYLKRHPMPEEIVLALEVSDSTYHRDRYEKYPIFARAGIPTYWIVNLARRQVEVYTDPSAEGYGSRRDYRPGESIPVVIDGQPIGQIAVDEILPPAPAAGPEGA